MVNCVKSTCFTTCHWLNPHNLLYPSPGRGPSLHHAHCQEVPVATAAVDVEELEDWKRAETR